MGATPASLLATVSRPPAWGGPWGLGSLGVQARQVGPSIKTKAVFSFNPNHTLTPKAGHPLLGGGDTLSRGSRGVDIPPFP